MRKVKISYEPELCGCCGQTKTYALSVDKGTVEIVRAIAKFIEKKGVNIVHPRKELEGNGLSSNQVGNLSRPRLHGLIAKVKGEAGNYLLTQKGSFFLNGEAIPRVAIIQKGIADNEGGARNIGYYKEVELTCKAKDFYNGEYWEGINYTIREGRVVRNNQTGATLF